MWRAGKLGASERSGREEPAIAQRLPGVYEFRDRTVLDAVKRPDYGQSGWVAEEEAEDTGLR